MKTGDKLGTWQVVEMVEMETATYTAKGRKRKYNALFGLLVNPKGQQRILRADKTKLNECETYRGTWGGSKYMTWNMIDWNKATVVKIK